MAQSTNRLGMEWTSFPRQPYSGSAGSGMALEALKRAVTIAA
jgi:hypothetical protein